VADTIRIEPRFPAEFDLAIYELPSTELLPFYQGSRFAIGQLAIFADVDENQRIDYDLMDLVLGNDMSTMDVKLAAADFSSEGFLIYLEGELPVGLAKFLGVGTQTCPNIPPQGFSILKGCEFLPPEEVVFRFELEYSPSVRDQVCEQPAGYVVPVETPAGTITCVNDPVWVETDTGEFCDQHEYYLRGCERDPYCSEPEWDLSSMPPNWWPCYQPPSFSFQDSPADLTQGGHDVLFEITYDWGPDAFDLDDIEILFCAEGQTNWASYLDRNRSRPNEISVDSYGTGLAVAARRSRAGEWGPVETCSRWGEGSMPS
jgi:hypothetical protein